MELVVENSTLFKHLQNDFQNDFNQQLVKSQFKTTDNIKITYNEYLYFLENNTDVSDDRILDYLHTFVFIDDKQSFVHIFDIYIDYINYKILTDNTYIKDFINTHQNEFENKHVLWLLKK